MIWQGTVTKITADGAFARVPDLGGIREFGPLAPTPGMAVGHRVVVGQFGKQPEALAILRNLDERQVVPIVDDYIQWHGSFTPAAGDTLYPLPLGTPDANASTYITIDGDGYINFGPDLPGGGLWQMYFTACPMDFAIGSRFTVRIFQDSFGELVPVGGTFSRSVFMGGGSGSELVQIAYEHAGVEIQWTLTIATLQINP